MDVHHGLRLTLYIHVPETLLRNKWNGGRKVVRCEKYLLCDAVMLSHPRDELLWGQEQPSWGQNPNPAVPAPFSSDTGLLAL